MLGQILLVIAGFSAEVSLNQSGEASRRTDGLAISAGPVAVPCRRQGADSACNRWKWFSARWQVPRTCGFGRVCGIEGAARLLLPRARLGRTSALVRRIRDGQTKQRRVASFHGSHLSARWFELSIELG